jgi:hypothetical protein
VGIDVPGVIAGFPDMWDQVFERFKPFFTAATNLTALQNRILAVPVVDQGPQILSLIVKTMTNDYGAVLTLVLNGYGVQAMKLARSMFEGGCLVHHLKTDPQALQDYINFEPITRKRFYDLMKPDRQKAIDPAAVENMNKDYAQAEPNFVNGKGRVRQNWSDVTVLKKAKAAGLEDLYHRHYNLASSMHHYDFQALVASMDPESDDIGIEPAPSMRWLGVALSTAHGSLIHALDQYLDLAKIGFEEEMKAVIEEYDAANKVLIAARAASL